MNTLNTNEIIKRYPQFIDVREHCIMVVRKGVVTESYKESHPKFEEMIKFIEQLNLPKIKRFSSILYILE